MTEKLRQLHLDIFQKFGESQGEKHYFALINSLKKLYLHPRLLKELDPIDDVAAVIEESTKLQKLLELLENIKMRREKVLIFAQLLDLQRLLTEVLEARFKIKIEVINGSADSTRKGLMSSRKKVIKDFEDKDGFNILILSPRVAGVGLTITGANHVVHFERWWNPAKEAQATDRAYRIGQTKDVYVYHLIYRDPDQKIVTFDEKLDELLSEKAKLAADFLIPRESVEVSAVEVASGLGNQENCDISPKRGRKLSSIRTILDVDRLSARQFECLIALIYRKQNLHAFLCPLTGDGGADVLAIGPKELVYAQCKHSSCGSTQTPDAISDLNDAPDKYRRDVLSDKLRTLRVQRVAWTNTRFGPDAKVLAAQFEIKLVEGKDIEKLLKKFDISLGEVLQIEVNRKRDLLEMKETLRRL